MRLLQKTCTNRNTSTNKKILLRQKTKNNIALFIAILFHVCGAIGILFTPYKNWFIKNTPVNLLLMSVLLIWTQPKKNKLFFLFFIICFIAGILVEMAGVNTGLLFGRYAYSDLLGFKFINTPIIIGINWFIVIYCIGIIILKFDKMLLRKMNAEQVFSSRMLAVSFLIDAALLAVFFDWMMEPAATKLGLWHWQNGAAPLFNYCCWLIISSILFAIFRILNFNKSNNFAIHLFILQMLFFSTIRSFL